MNILEKIGLGKAVGEVVASPIEALGNAFDQILTSDEERAQGEAILEKIRQHPNILQIELNKIEAAHPSLFVAGWRPFIGWTCGFALNINFIVLPLCSICASIFSEGWVSPTLPGIGELVNLLLALLGMAGLRSWEKNNNLTK